MLNLSDLWGGLLFDLWGSLLFLRFKFYLLLKKEKTLLYISAPYISSCILRKVSLSSSADTPFNRLLLSPVTVLFTTL